MKWKNDHGRADTVAEFQKMTRHELEGTWVKKRKLQIQGKARTKVKSELEH